MINILQVALFALSIPTGLMAFVPSQQQHRNAIMISSSVSSSLDATVESETDSSASSSSTTTTDAPTPTTPTTKKKDKMFDEFLNEKELLDQSTFPIKPDALMDRAKYVLGPDCGIGTLDDAKCLAENFEFIAAVVGPIPRAAYLDALTNFNLADSFDITSNYFGMHVDPLQPNRVWFMNRVRGVHTGDFMGASPTGNEIIYPPQTLHLDFNEDGNVTEFGFYTSDRRQGSTGGLGGAFGFMYGVGKPLPIPECQPYRPSKRFRLLQVIGKVAEKFQKK